MPPAGRAAPPAEARDGARVVTSRRRSIARRALAPNPGRPLAHRLNRAEYANAIRDLLDARDRRRDAAAARRLERRLRQQRRRARRVAGAARELPDGRRAHQRAGARRSASSRRPARSTGCGRTPRRTSTSRACRSARSAACARSDAAARRRVPVPGQAVPHQPRHDARPRVPAPARDRGGRRARPPGLVRRRQGDCRVEREPDDDRRRRGRPLHARACRSRPVRDASRLRSSRRRTRSTRGGCRTTCAAPSDTIDFSGYPHIDQFIFTGPFNPTGPGDTPSRRRIFVCQPKDAAPTRSRARRAILCDARRARAYRGDVHRRRSAACCSTSSAAAAPDGSTFEAGIDLALRRLLASPKFVFRVERDPAGVAPGAAYRAERPRARLAALVLPLEQHPGRRAARRWRAQGRLHEPATLEQQVRRMLADPKAQALVDNFVGQWLQLRNLRNKQPNSHEFPDFDDNLRRRCDTETRAVLQPRSCARTAACST